MIGEGNREEELGDGLGGEVNALDAAINDADDGFAAEGYEDELSGLELEFGRIGKNSAAAAEDFCGDYLEKHGYIIAYARGISG